MNSGRVTHQFRAAVPEMSPAIIVHWCNGGCTVDVTVPFFLFFIFYHFQYFWPSFFFNENKKRTFAKKVLFYSQPKKQKTKTERGNNFPHACVKTRTVSQRKYSDAHLSAGVWSASHATLLSPLPCSCRWQLRHYSLSTLHAISAAKKKKKKRIATRRRYQKEGKHAHQQKRDARIKKKVVLAPMQLTSNGSPASVLTTITSRK